MRFIQGHDPADKLAEAERARLERSIERRFRKELRDSRERLHRVERQNEKSAAVAKRYAAELAETRNRLTARETASVELQEALEKAERAQDDLQDKLIELEWQREGLSARVAEAEQASAETRKHLDETQLELERARGKIASLLASTGRGFVTASSDERADDEKGPVDDLEIPDSGLRCGVCNRMPQGVRAEELEEAGWVVGDELCLCAECFQRGWRPPFDERGRRKLFHRA